MTVVLLSEGTRLYVDDPEHTTRITIAAEVIGDPDNSRPTPLFTLNVAERVALVRALGGDIHDDGGHLG